MSRVEADLSSSTRVPPSPPPTPSWPLPSSPLLQLHSPQSLHKSSCLTDRKLTCESFLIYPNFNFGVAGPPPRLDPGQASSLPPPSTPPPPQDLLPPVLTQSLHNHHVRPQSRNPGTSDLVDTSYVAMLRTASSKQ